MPVPPHVPIITETGNFIITEPGTAFIITEGNLPAPGPPYLVTFNNPGLPVSWPIKPMRRK